MNILLVEDNEGHAELVKRSLRRNGHITDINHLIDGEQALNYLFQKEEFSNTAKTLPDLILLDLRMPKVNGLEVLEVIKNDPRLYTIPVVILTTSEAESDIKKAYELRVNSYLIKPMDFHQFSKQIFELAVYWLEWNKQPYKK